MSGAEPSNDLARALREAVALHQAGRLDQAQSLYEWVLKSDPHNDDALNLLGVIAQARGQIEQARQLFERAIRSNPAAADFHFNLGNLQMAANERLAALEAFEKALALKQDHAAALLNAGVVLEQLGRYAEAAERFRVFVCLTPNDARGHYNLGHCYLRLNRADEAEGCFKRVLELEPRYLAAHLSLATLYTETDRLADAIRHTQDAVALSPQPQLQSNLGDLLKRAGDFAAALKHHRAAISALPSDPVVLHNYGTALHAAGYLPEAETAFRDAIAHNPRLVEAYVGLAKVQEHRRALSDAIATLNAALDIEPGSSLLRFKLSMLQLMTGDLREGWRNYEHRLHSVDSKSRRPVPPPYWAGEDLAGKTIMVWTDQGLGDEILYAGMFAELIACAGKCLIACSSRMVPVFARSFPAADVVPHDTTHKTDYQIAATGLGPIFRADSACFPRHQGYLKADPARAAALRARYRAIAPGNIVVGLSWRSRNAEMGALKSADPSTWRDVFGVPGVTFVNLQYGDCTRELARIKEQSGVDVFHDRDIDALHSMDDFFSQVAAMDLVISTSNTAVHVAGSLNVPTLLMLPDGPGTPWYWLESGGVSLWYPSVRTYRGAHQPVRALNRWTDGLIPQIVAGLRATRRA